MKAVYAFLFFILFSFKGFSQFELPKKTITIAPVSNPKGADSPTSSKSISYPSIFDKKDKLGENVSLLKKKPEEEKSIFEKEGYDWISWYLYERDGFGGKVLSANDADGNEICHNIKSLWETVKDYMDEKNN